MAEVTTTHKDYDANRTRWQKCRDFAAGSEAVKKAGEKYLPKLGGQEPDEYEAYKKRAMFYGATGRTVKALVGAVMRKPVTVTVDDEDTTEDPVFQNVDLAGNDIDAFAKQIVSEVVTVGRYGVLTDWNDNYQRPVLVGYTAEEIINWRVEIINGQQTLTMVVLVEQIASPDNDEFEADTVKQYRVLDLFSEDGGPAVYRVRLYDEEGNMSEETFPQRVGERLDFIPFQFVGPDSSAASPDLPPLLDLIEINNSHYMNSADLEHGLHYTGLPTPWAAGFQFDEDNPMVIGSQRAWVTDHPDARTGYLEFTGSGLSSLENAMARKENAMARIGAKILEPPRKGVEAAETARIAQAGDVSVLSGIAMNIASALSNCVRWAMWWAQAGGTVDDISATVTLNTDYVDLRLSAAEVMSYIAAYQSGGISYDTLFYLLKRGETIPPGRSKEEEQAALEQAGPLDTTDDVQQ